jgi:hypothetical protein
MNTKDLIREHNALAEQFGLPPLNGWKASKEALQARIEGLMAQQPADPLDIDPLALTEADKPTVTFETEENANPEPLVTEAQEPLGDTEPDTVPPEAAEEPGDDYGEPDEPRGSIGQMVAELLLDAEGYDYQEIVEIVRGLFPQAKTSRRSIASVAAALRRKDVGVPMRRKPRSAKG